MYISHAMIVFLLETTSLEWGSLPLNVLSIIGGGAPAFAAIIMLFKMYSEEEKKTYWKRVFLYKVHFFWWILALFSPLVIGLVANLIYNDGWWYPGLEMAEIIAFPILFGFMIFAGGIEELGWRGILQDTLSKKLNLMVIGIGIGVLWGVWHAPLFLIDVFAHYDYAFSTYLLSTVVYSLILTLIFYKTKSILLPVLMHASINAFGNLGFGIPLEIHTPLILFLVVLLIAFTFVLHFVENK
ncbi:Metal-dependent membrane protease CAAX family [Methanonatronarchaeum thermophilum]|uniref:Metal-dependent membrane protease CAAX family n=1 Tax=Methanonatronarchaeum thermophilum TaxID=1927129 RepID=A0A1Y3GD49_9EURY|nr:CPBP family intramembrane glutamic endopeptidase [Methanonatronarchaeum thermophilum]OUJ19167.1 Metal-dependent membrane protease CAAX family [Methanonatronarchaeum thermophilum]